MSHRPDSILRCRDSSGQCRDTPLLRRPDHNRRTTPDPVLSVGRLDSGCRDRACPYTGSKMAGKKHLPLTLMLRSSTRTRRSCSSSSPPDPDQPTWKSSIPCDVPRLPEYFLSVPL